MPPTCCSNNITSSGLHRSDPRRSGSLQLAVAVAAILVMWLAVLPWIAAQPPVQRHIEFLEQRQIDPSAMFYTELDTMDELRAEITRIREDHPASFW